MLWIIYYQIIECIKETTGGHNHKDWSYYWEASTLQMQPAEVFYKKMFLKISQNSRQNTCARASLLIKLQTCNFIKKRNSGTSVFL